MSTKASLDYEDGEFHFYEDAFDKNSVYLTLNNATDFEMSRVDGCDVSVTVKIPLSVWNRIVEVGKREEEAKILEECE